MNNTNSNDLIANTATTFALDTVKWPLNITFQEYGSLCPTDDITPKECTLLCMLLVSAAVGSWGVDYPRFIRENKLEKHFKL